MADSFDTVANGINTSGIVCGTFVPNATFLDHGFFFDGRNFTQFDVPGALYTDVEGINDAGDFVGYTSSDPGVSTPFVNIAGKVTSFTLPGVSVAYAMAINNLGQIVGQYTDPVDPDVTHGFFRDADGTLTYPLDFPNTRSTALFGINDRGVMVGSDTDLELYLHAIVMRPPHLFLSYDFAPGADTWFTGINNSGLISGFYFGPKRKDGGAFVARLVP